MQQTEPAAGDRTPYLREFRVNWRYLLAASLGMASGYTINNYLNNVFFPPMMEEFGWSSSNIALIGATSALSIIFQPLAGRITDRFGVRSVALFGVFASAAIYLLLSAMTGSFFVFLLLAMLQIALVTSTTGAVVYSRLIAQSFSKARGMGLAVAICAPSVAGAVVVPLLTQFIETEGWRSGYRLAAAITFAVGVLALLMIPGRRRTAVVGTSANEPAADLRAILRGPALKLILGGVMLGSLSISLQTTQLKVVILAAGFASTQASSLISIYALGVIAGRFLSGAALDALPTYVVAAGVMSLPGVALLILASGSANTALFLVAMVLLGVSLGAEGDVAAYLVMRYFPLPVYSTVLGVVIGSIAFASGIGGLILSGMLRVTDDFAPFLAMTGVCALLGGGLLWRLRTLPAEMLANPETVGAGGSGTDGSKC